MSRIELFKSIAQEQSFTDLFQGKVGQVFPVGPFQLIHEAYSGAVDIGIIKRSDHGLEALVDLEYMANKVSNSLTAYYFQDEMLSLPIFIIDPRSSWDFLGKYLGPKKFKVPLYPDFNEKYQILSPVRNFDIAMINEQVYSFLSFEHGWTIEGNGKQMLMYKEDFMIPDDRIKAFLQAGRSISEMLKGEKVL